MQSRRWWYSIAITLTLAGLASPSLGAPAATAPTAAEIDTWVKTQVAAMVASTNPEPCRKIGENILNKMEDFNKQVTNYDKFARAVANEVNAQILDVKTEPAAFVVVSGVSTLVESHIRTSNIGIPPAGNVLTNRLSHKNPAVRFWLAKGLVTVLPKMNATDRTRAVKALQAAIGAETSGPARSMEFRAIATAGEAKIINDELTKIVAGLRAKGPSASDADNVAADLDSLATALRGANLNPADTTAAVTTAANAASFTAQHAAKAELAHDASAKQLHAAALEVCNAAIRTVNAAAKANLYRPVAADSASVLLVAVDEWTNPRNTESALQKKFPGVPYPPRIGEPPARTPATAAKGK